MDTSDDRTYSDPAYTENSHSSPKNSNDTAFPFNKNAFGRTRLGGLLQRKKEYAPLEISSPTNRGRTFSGEQSPTSSQHEMIDRSASMAVRKETLDFGGETSGIFITKNTELEDQEKMSPIRLEPVSPNRNDNENGKEGYFTFRGGENENEEVKVEKNFPMSLVQSKDEENKLQKKKRAERRKKAEKGDKELQDIVYKKEEQEKNEDKKKKTRKERLVQMPVSKREEDNASGMTTGLKKIRGKLGMLRIKKNEGMEKAKQEEPEQIQKKNILQKSPLLKAVLAKSQNSDRNENVGKEIAREFDVVRKGSEETSLVVASDRVSYNQGKGLIDDEKGEKEKGAKKPERKKKEEKKEEAKPKKKEKSSSKKKRRELYEAVGQDENEGKKLAKKSKNKRKNPDDEDEPSNIL